MGTAAIKPAQGALSTPCHEPKPLRLQPFCSEAPPQLLADAIEMHPLQGSQDMRQTCTSMFLEVHFTGGLAF